MRSDDDVDGARGECIDHAILFLVRAKPRQLLDANRPIRKTVQEILMMLLNKQRGRRQQGNLFSILHGYECSSHGNLGFAKARVSTDQAIHGLVILHIG